MCCRPAPISRTQFEQRHDERWHFERRAARSPDVAPLRRRRRRLCVLRNTRRAAALAATLLGLLLAISGFNVVNSYVGRDWRAKTRPVLQVSIPIECSRATTEPLRSRRKVKTSRRTNVQRDCETFTPVRSRSKGVSTSWRVRSNRSKARRAVPSGRSKQMPAIGFASCAMKREATRRPPQTRACGEPRLGATVHGRGRRVE
jgi:hypothetical protein